MKLSTLLLKCAKDPIEFESENVEGLSGKLVFHRWTDEKGGKVIISDFDNDKSVELELISSHGGITESSLTISADANKIAYSGYTGHNTNLGYQLFISNIDGTIHHMITFEKNDDNRIWPAWHPNSESLFYVLGNFHGGYIYQSKLDGSENIQISDFKVFGSISISKDGTKLLFAKGISFNGEGIFIFNLVDESLKQIIPYNSALIPYNPEFSPDESKIAYVVREGPPNEVPSFFRIMTINVDGTKDTVVIDLPSEEHITDPTVTWSPDGSKLAFDYGSGINNELKSHIYIVNIDGSDMTQITDSPRYDAAPDWVR